jgi:positive regulator of sigma E activity
VFLGIGVLAYSHQAIGVSIVFAASLLLIVSSLKVAAGAPLPERKSLRVAAVGYVLMLAGLIVILFFSNGLIGAALVLLGALTGLAGSMLTRFRRSAQEADQPGISGRI